MVRASRDMDRWNLAGWGMALFGPVRYGEIRYGMVNYPPKIDLITLVASFLAIALDIADIEAGSNID